MVDGPSGADADQVETPRPATIVDVARAAFVSPSTASLALSGRKGVTEATRERVREAAQQLRYRPNLTARSLRGGTVGPVGIVVDPSLIDDVHDVSRLFAHRLLLTLNSGLAQLGVPVSYLDADADNLPATSIIVVLGRPTLSPSLAALLTDVPFLAAGFEPGDGQVPKASFHHDHAAYADELVAHLVAQGATKLAVLREDADANYSVIGSEAVAEAAGRQGLAVEVIASAIDPVAVQSRTAAVVREGADAVFAMFPFPGAILAGVSAAGKRVPDDVLVVDRAEGTIEAEVRPRVSSLSMDALGSAAAILAAIRQLIAQGSPQSATLPHKLIVRESSTRK